MFSATLALVLLYLTSIYICLVSTECISKYQQTELQLCCQMEELIPRHVRTKCQEKAAVHHNPGMESYDMCLKQCMFEELGAIDGYDIHLEMLYIIADSFPVDYRRALRLAIEECNRRMQNIKIDKPKHEDQCSKVGQQVERCLQAATYSNCPISRWRASTACNKARRKVPYC